MMSHAVSLPLALFGLGPMEMGALLVLGVILFGRRLPEVGRSLGKGIVEFKKGMAGLEDEVQNSFRQVDSAPPPAAAPVRPPQRVATSAPKFEDTNMTQPNV